MKRIAVAAAVGVLAVCVYWPTAYPSITWWDSSSYSLAAATFGVSSSPGSLLLMLIGWPIAHLPAGASPAYRLNLLAGVLAAAAAVGVYLCAMLVLSRDVQHRTHRDADDIGNHRRIGAVAGALAFAFGSTTWEYAVQYTPYILTVAFTAALLYTLLRWWEVAEDQDAWKWLALLGLLLGLDFSVHRTNALLAPAAFAFILIRHPRAVVQPRAILASVGALLAGLSVHLLLIPIARFTNSELNFGNPRDFGRFREYVSLPNSGGNFLVKVFPRNADFWDVQVRDFVSALRDNTLNWRGESSVAGALPAIAACIGLVAVWRRSPRLAMALCTLLLLHAVMTVWFFNIPADYFRSLHRHYLPVMATIGVFMACGLGAVAEWLARQRPVRAPVAWGLTALLFAAPLAQLIENWRTHDASRRFFAHDYAMNALTTLPPNAIHFTVGDNDTFPLMYLQQVEQVRTDVRIVNMSVLNYVDYPDQQHALHPSFPISLLSRERSAVAAQPWTDTSVTIPFNGDNARFGLAPEDTALKSATFSIKPVWAGKMLLGDITLLDIIRTNQWRRPVTFAVTATRMGMSWLEPYGRLEGMYWRIVPIRNPKGNAEALRTNLLSRHSYRGYADTTVLLDPVAAQFGPLYYQSAAELAQLEMARGDTASCQRLATTMKAAIPPTRLRLPPEMQGATLLECGR